MQFDWIDPSPRHSYVDRDGDWARTLTFPEFTRVVILAIERSVRRIEQARRIRDVLLGVR